MLTWLLSTLADLSYGLPLGFIIGAQWAKHTLAKAEPRETQWIDLELTATREGPAS